MLISTKLCLKNWDNQESNNGTFVFKELRQCLFWEEIQQLIYSYFSWPFLFLPASVWMPKIVCYSCHLPDIVNTVLCSPDSPLEFTGLFPQLLGVLSSKFSPELEDHHLGQGHAPSPEHPAYSEWSRVQGPNPKSGHYVWATQASGSSWGRMRLWYYCIGAQLLPLHNPASFPSWDIP